MEQPFSLETAGPEICASGKPGMERPACYGFRAEQRPNSELGQTKERGEGMEGRKKEERKEGKNEGRRRKKEGRKRKGGKKSTAR